MRRVAAVLVLAAALAGWQATPAMAAGTKIKLRSSDYGRMLFGPGRQAIYIFENDERKKSNCYGQCARAWPPVLTKGKPVAGKRVRQRLLGRTTRRNGKKQVTYDGQPLYYYAHEGPDEVLCHDVFLNGGYWWVVGPGGNRRP
jgi:predicted lipoprotein with Yx(FWY)xxD motif